MSKAQLAAYAARVSEVLTTLISSDDPHMERIISAMNYSLMAGGKRLRPVLVMACCEACGGTVSDDVVRVASALECVHTYSLVHDDLPGMDNDSLRRGKPTNHVVYGEAMAILAGDGLLTEGFTIISQYAPDAVTAAGLMAELAYGAGWRGMVGGQAQDILCEGREIDALTMRWIHAHKTGALIITACRMGGILAGADVSRLETLTRYGTQLGLAFQITDDILDVVGDTEKMGKTLGKDESVQKATYPALFGLDESRRLAAQAVAEAKEALADFGAEADFLHWLADYVYERQQ